MAGAGRPTTGLSWVYRRFVRAPPRRRVVAAVPVRSSASGAVEFLVVRTSTGERWTFPKGGCERRESLARAAAREALEEAGAAGSIGAEPIGAYRYGDNAVMAYLLEVERDGLPAEPARDPTWCDFDGALGRLALGRDGAFVAEMRHVLLAAQRAAGR